MSVERAIECRSRSADAADRTARARRLARSQPWLVADLAAAGVLGFIRLGQKPLWHDEAYTAAMAVTPFRVFWQALARQEAFAGVYYSILRVWTSVSTSEAWLRLPSVLFGVASVAALFVLTRRLFGTTAAAIAGGLLAVNAFSVRYQQEARAYSMAMFASVLATYALVVAVEHESRRRWLAYAAAATFAVYAHAFALFVVAAHAVWLVARRRLSLAAAVAFASCGLLVAPLLTVLAVSSDIERGIPHPGLRAVASAFLNLTGGGGVRTPAAVLLLLGCGAFATIGVVTSFVRHRRRAIGTDGPSSALLAIAWIAVPICGSLALSAVRPIFLSRYLIVVVPALAMLTAVGIASLRPVAVRATALCALLLLSAPPLVAYYGQPFKDGEDWRTAVANVVARERPGDGIIFLSRFGRRPFEYYLTRSDAEADLTPIYPSAPWERYPPVLPDERYAPAAVQASDLSARFDRVWVVLLWGRFGSPHEGGRTVERELDADYRVVWRASRGRYLDVVLYVRASSESTAS